MTEIIQLTSMHSEIAGRSPLEISSWGKQIMRGGHAFREKKEGRSTFYTTERQQIY